MKALLALMSSFVAAASLVVAADAPSAAPAAMNRVSVSSAGAQGNRDSFAAGISANARFVVINSLATDLVEGDTNDRWDVFVHDGATGSTNRVSVSSSGAQAKAMRSPFGGSIGGGISADGRYVVFQSDAPNLVRGDTNRNQDVFFATARPVAQSA